MASGFWVFSMTERARLISAFVTPLGLFEWLRMPFGLKNAPQIYQRLLDNALYGFLRISPGAATEETKDLFATGEPDAKSGLSIAVKSTWGYRKVEYLGHRVSKGGLEAHPKDLQSLVDLPLPTTLKAMQSFLGSLNYYSRYIEDYAIYASILYELREVDFHAWRCKWKANEEVTAQEDDEEKWSKVQVAFAMLKNKIATASILRHFDPAREAVIIVYASDWAISASLVQNYDGLYMPVMFTSRTLKSNEVNYSTVEKEVLALLRILETCFTMLVTRPLKVLTRHSTLAWLVKSSGLQVRLGNWAALLSQWTLEIVKCKKGEDQVLGALAASITPRKNVDSILSSIAPKKQSRQVADLPTPTVELNEELYVMSFDGSARVKQGGGACSAIVWRLPAWTIVAAASKYLDKSTVNEAEYEGMLLGFDLLEPMERRRLIICGDSNLVIRQMRGEIECKASGFSPLRAKALSKLQSWSTHAVYM
ncbi:unnamed protein product [Peronospora farinosa]|uniref:Reverse transcriptase/retrotransposon-derived protein RNase H-like domain-containing protein n=3 Tax=Peronospora farinosa TaxID=134698 RepID=A0AAV0STS9_9STRA|nr:unnamed protein product [Peronospora farinosa]